ncbi:MAG: GNAT family N-acetyltransferase [Micrococcales bacterium]|nr:GNAT family N-acetyltransferase [Micrococcales bacterium]
MTGTPDLSEKPTLRGEKVVLRPLVGDDAPAMAEILSDPEVRRLTGSVGTTAEAQRPQPLDDGLRHWYATRSQQPDRLDLAVVDAESGRVVGEVVLNEYDDGGRTTNLRCLLGPEGRGRGLGTEAVWLLCRYAFAVGIERVTLEVFEFNPRARHVYEKVGFVPTGVRPEALLFDGVEVAALDMELTPRALSSSGR